MKSKLYSLAVLIVSLIIAFLLWAEEKKHFHNKSKQYISYITERIEHNVDHYLSSNYQTIENNLLLISDSDLDSGKIRKIFDLYIRNTQDVALEYVLMIKNNNTWFYPNLNEDFLAEENKYSEKRIAFDKKSKKIIFRFQKNENTVIFYFDPIKFINAVSNIERHELVMFDVFINGEIITSKARIDSTDIQTSNLRILGSTVDIRFKPKLNHESYINKYNAEFIFLVVALFGITVSMLLFFLLDRENSKKKISEKYKKHEDSLIEFNKIISEESNDLMNKIEMIISFICKELNLDLGIVSEVEENSYKILCKSSKLHDFIVSDKITTENTFCQFTINKEDFFWILDAEKEEYQNLFTYRQYGLKSYIGYPITINSKVFGSLCFLGKSVKNTEFTNYEKNLIKLGAEWISSNLKNHFISVKSKEYYENFQKIFNLNKDGILINDGESILEVNDGFCSISGFTKEELIGRNIYDTIHPEEVDYVKSKIFNDYIGLYETRGIKSDGSEYIIEINVQKFLYKNKTARLAFIHDITFQRQYEHALTESKQFLLEILNSISDAISVHDDKGLTVIANKSYYEQESINKNLLSVNHEAENGEYISTDQSEKRTYHSKNTRLETTTGKVYHVTISRDITDITKAEQNLLESEKLFKNVIESLQEGLLLVDQEGFIIYGNKQLENITGYKADEITFQNSYEVFFEDNNFDISDALRDNEIKKRELQVKQKNGNYIWVELSLIPILEADGHEIGLLMAIMDIQTRKEAEIQLLKSLKEKEFLLKEVHHRVKNNLQVISSLLNLQHSYIDEPYYKSIFKESQNRVRSMALIHEKLYQNEYFSEIDIQHYIYSLTSNLKNSYRHESQFVQFNFDIDNIFLSIDQAIPCGLILNELISNSLKYAFGERKEGVISISFRLDTDKKALLIMKDNGKGFPENFNIEKSETLGLKIVETLAEQINAEIEIKSKNGVQIKIEFKIENLEETDAFA